MKKRVFNWAHSHNKKFEGRVCPNFDFVKACEKGVVVWWNDNQLCIDLDRLNLVKE